MLNQDGIYKLKFTEPGGVVEAGVMVKNHEIIQCMMGGDIKLAGEEALSGGNLSGKEQTVKHPFLFRLRQEEGRVFLYDMIKPDCFIERTGR